MKYPGIFDTEFLFNLICGIEVCDRKSVFRLSFLVWVSFKHLFYIALPNKWKPTAQLISSKMSCINHFINSLQWKPQQSSSLSDRQIFLIFNIHQRLFTLNDLNPLLFLLNPFCSYGLFISQIRASVWAVFRSYFLCYEFLATPLTNLFNSNVALCHFTWIFRVYFSLISPVLFHHLKPS